MLKMLKKYNNAIELIQESGKIPVGSIDDGDLADLLIELKEYGFDCELDESTDYIRII